ncbi:unnamed protein product [Peniophora sp. CBMAI 1063]|nr:unnamed protein product [Peniophora sp. CBMAI 1063]
MTGEGVVEAERRGIMRLEQRKGVRFHGRGRLNALPGMPLDILEEIFSRLDPGDLIRVARTTKAFRRLLITNNQFSHLWRDSWARVEGYPACPDAFPLMSWIHLLFGGSYCQICAAPSGRRVYFSIRARVCKNCLRSSLVRIESTTVDTIRPRQLHKYIPVVNEGRNLYAHSEDLKDLGATLSSITEGVESIERHAILAAAKESLRSSFLPRLSHQQNCEEWQRRVIAERSDDLMEQRRDRRDDIVMRLQELGYQSSDACDIWGLKGVSSSKPLTDRSWNTLLPTLLPALNRARNRRREAGREMRRNRRLDAAEKAYVDLLQSDVVDPKDIPYLPWPGECTEFGLLPTLIDEDEDELSSEWMQRVDAALGDALRLMHHSLQRHVAEFASLLPGFDGSVPEANLRDIPSIDLDDLATSVFVVKKPFDSWRNVCFGKEVVACSAVRPYFSSSEAGSEYCDSRLTCVVQPTPASVVAAVQMLLNILRLSFLTTIPELDVLDPAFICKTCPTQHNRYYLYDDEHRHELYYRQLLNWRDVVQHVLDVHDDNPGYVRLHVLSDGERTAIGAEGTLVALRHSFYGESRMATPFACCHCTEESMPSTSPGRLHYYSREDAHIHSFHRHGIGSAVEGIDYFQGPLEHRGVLGGTRREYCLWEEQSEAVDDSTYSPPSLF